jgi:hypothetical protein
MKRGKASADTAVIRLDGSDGVRERVERRNREVLSTGRRAQADRLVVAVKRL